MEKLDPGAGVAPVAPPPLSATVALYPEGRCRMQRDMELIRAICRHVVERGDVYPRVVEIDGHEGWVVAHHVDLLHRAGLIDGTRSSEMGNPVPTILVRDLTWEGHDFAGAMANSTLWGQIKSSISPAVLAAMPLKAVAAVAGELAVAVAKAKLGLA